MSRTALQLATWAGYPSSMQRVEGVPELLDGSLDRRLLDDNLRDLARFNRFLGGSRLSWNALRYVLAEAGPTEPVRLLDVGTGAADIPAEFHDRAIAGGRRLTIEAIDIRPEIVAAAQARTAARPGLHISLAAGPPFDFPPTSFDIVHASLVLHHSDPPDARRLLAELARLARRAVIVNDLERGRSLLAGAWLLTRLVTANQYTRHDAPLSIRRAYTADEMSALAAAAGVRERRRFHAPFGYRYAIVFEPAR